jgi:hypothetical protein
MTALIRKYPGVIRGARVTECRTVGHNEATFEAYLSVLLRREVVASRDEISAKKR